MYDKKERKQTHLKHADLKVYFKVYTLRYTIVSIKRLFATIFFLCQTLGIIRISTQASTTFKLKSPVSELHHIVSITSTITWSGYQNTVNLFSEVV